MVVTSCAEEGIFLLYHAFLRPGDHAIVETPCYESALQLARSTGAEVSQWRRRYEDGWAHDLDALAGLIRPATRLIYLNQPHNPTGTLMARPVFEHVIGLARAHGLVVFSDEVYRELEHDPAGRLPAACDEYERAVSLGSISKSYGLPGLRIGWIATRDAALRDAVSMLKDYTTICASAPSEFLTALALRNRRVLLDRNLAIVRRNLPLLDGFFERHADTFDWVQADGQPDRLPPGAGGSATSPGTARGSPRPASCSSRARSTTSRNMSGSALAGPTCPRRSASSRRTSPAAGDGRYVSWTCLTSMAGASGSPRQDRRGCHRIRRLERLLWRARRWSWPVALVWPSGRVRGAGSAPIRVVPHPRRVMPPVGSGSGLPVYPSEASGRARTAIAGRAP